MSAGTAGRGVLVGVAVGGTGVFVTVNVGGAVGGIDVAVTVGVAVDVAMTVGGMGVFVTVDVGAAVGGMDVAVAVNVFVGGSGGWSAAHKLQPPIKPSSRTSPPSPQPHTHFWGGVLSAG